MLAYLSFPAEHWRRIRSTYVLERLDRELAGCCDVVGIFPNVAAAMRQLGALVEEQQDAWLVSRWYLSLESMAKISPPRAGKACRWQRSSMLRSCCPTNSTYMARQ